MIKKRRKLLICFIAFILSFTRNAEIQLTCALCGVKVPELETFSFLFWDSGRKRNK
nr:MAG TPA: hypothetical protein [Bacteriophage sp.]